MIKHGIQKLIKFQTISLWYCECFLSLFYMSANDLTITLQLYKLLFLLANLVNLENNRTVCFYSLYKPLTMNIIYLNNKITLFFYISLHNSFIAYCECSSRQNALMNMQNTGLTSRLYLIQITPFVQHHCTCII